MAIGPINSTAIPMAQPHIAPAQVPARVGENALPTPVSEAETVSFADVFGQLVASANDRGHSAQHAAVELAEGRNDDIHGVMIEMQKAGIETRLVGTIKNKVTDAFYELWRMNI